MRAQTGILVRMKKAGWIATVAAGVVLVGGGAWGATMLAVSDEATIASSTIAPTPVASATPEVTPTPTVEAMPEATADELFLEDAQLLKSLGDFEMPDEELLAAGYDACGYIAEMGTTNLGHDVRLVPTTSTGVHNNFVALADEHLCD